MDTAAIITAVISSLLTGGVASLGTVKALQVHIQYLREALAELKKSQQEEKEESRVRLQRMDDHLRAQFLAVQDMAGRRQQEAGANVRKWQE